MTTRESDPMTIDRAVAQARELLAALDQQLLAATCQETDDARERVALLAFGLTALLEQLSTCAPDNEQTEPSAPRRPVLSFHEVYPAGPGRRLVVARFCARWFVIEGFEGSPLDTYRVDKDAGPYDSQSEARACAKRKTGMHGWKVVEA